MLRKCFACDSTESGNGTLAATPNKTVIMILTVETVLLDFMKYAGTKVATSDLLGRTTHLPAVLCLPYQNLIVTKPVQLTIMWSSLRSFIKGAQYNNQQL